MKTLKTYISESILGDIDNTIKQGNDNIEKLETFGKHYKFVRAICGSASASMLNALTLKKLTKNMDFINAGVKNGQFDKQQKIQMFANWLDHLKFEDLGISLSEISTNDEFRRVFSEKFEKYCFDNKIFNTDSVHLWIVSIAASSKNHFDVIVGRTDKYSNSYVFKLFYELA